jgi:hypothetical protein
MKHVFAGVVTMIAVTAVTALIPPWPARRRCRRAARRSPSAPLSAGRSRRARLRLPRRVRSTLRRDRRTVYGEPACYGRGPTVWDGSLVRPVNLRFIPRAVAQSSRCTGAVERPNLHGLPRQHLASASTNSATTAEGSECEAYGCVRSDGARCQITSGNKAAASCSAHVREPGSALTSTAMRFLLRPRSLATEILARSRPRRPDASSR